MVIGSGGREHALGWKLGQSEEVSEVIYAPGNAGTQEEKGRNIPIDGSKKNNFQNIFQNVRETCPTCITGSVRLRMREHLRWHYSFARELRASRVNVPAPDFR